MEMHNMPRTNFWLGLSMATLAQLLVLCAMTSEAAMNLPDGIENILGFVPTSRFQCERDGYFGDIDNDCRLFHLCQKQVHPGGRVEWRHWTYACGNQTMFNQLTLTCAFVDEAIPCRHATQFQYLNEVIHKPREPFLTDADVTSGISYYSNRIMSDGARARAYEDAQLMAQLGGGGGSSPFNNQIVLVEAPKAALTQVDEMMPRSSNELASAEETFRADLASNSQSAATAQLLQQPTQHFRPAPEAATSSFFAASSTANVEQASSPSQPSNSFSSQQPSVAQSFDFSIATNHQIGPASGDLALELGLNHLQSLQQQHQFQQNQQNFFAQPSQFLSDQQFHHPQAPPPPPPPKPQQQQPLEVKVTTKMPQLVVTLQPTTSSSLLTTSAGSGTTTPTRQLAPETAATTTIKPLATTLTAPTTTTTTMIAPVVNLGPSAPIQNQRPASSQQMRRRQAASSSRTNQQLSRQQASSSADFSHSPGFQSTRIARSRPTRQDAALVMRPTTITTTASSRSSPTPTTRQPLRMTLAASPSSGEPVGSSAFWRRPFDAHFEAPRFELLLTRRRV